MEKVSTAAAKSSSNISQQRLTIGLDLGDRNTWYCVVDETGQMQQEQRIRTNAKALREVFSGKFGDTRDVHYSSRAPQGESRTYCPRTWALLRSGAGGPTSGFIWSGRADLNRGPPAPKDWSHEESTTCTEHDEL